MPSNIALRSPLRFLLFSLDDSSIDFFLAIIVSHPFASFSSVFKNTRIVTFAAAIKITTLTIRKIIVGPIWAGQGHKAVGRVSDPWQPDGGIMMECA